VLLIEDRWLASIPVVDAMHVIGDRIGRGSVWVGEVADPPVSGWGDADLLAQLSNERVRHA
jgi:hypothetical protein